MQRNQIIAQWNKDENGNSYAIDITEILVVSPISYQVQLSQIPYELTGVEVLTPINMVECFDVDDIGTLNYKVVSYNDRRVQFHPYMSGKTVTIKYKGLGIEYLSAYSVYALTDANGNVLKTIGDVIDEATIQLELIKTLGDAVIIINKLNQVVHNAEILDDSLRGLIDVGNPMYGRSMYRSISMLHEDGDIVVYFSFISEKNKRGIGMVKAKDFDSIKTIRKIKGTRIDLNNNDTILELIKRIEELENKHN